MKKVILFLSFVSFALFSCEQEQISSQGQASGKGSKYMSPAVESGIGADLPPEDPEGQGGAGGDLTFYPPQSPTISNASPFVIPGQTHAVFTPNGSITSDLIALGPADPQAYFPSVFTPTAARLWMGFSFVDNGVKYTVRGYPLLVNNGTPLYVSSPVEIQLVLSTNSSGPNMQFVPTQFDQQGNIIKLAGWECVACNGAGTVQGTAAISQVSMSSDGKLSISAIVTMPGKTVQINKIGYRRV